MDRNFARALKLVLKHEGGYVNNPADPGGVTNRGVTIGTFRSYVKPGGTVADLKNITDAQVATVYRRHYWDAVLGAELPDGVDYAVFDFAVNSGPARAAKYLQDVLGAVQDGKIGPATLKLARARMHAGIINELCDKRLAFLKRLPTWKTFGRGWSVRVLDVRRNALAMLSGGEPEPVVVVPAPKPATPVAAPVAPAGGFWAALARIISRLFTRKATL